MRSFFLTRLAAGAFAGKGRRLRAGRLVSRGFESLSPRQLLAADTGDPAEDAAYVAPAGTESNETLLIAPDSPLWGDESGSQTSTLQDDGYGYGYGNLAPVITSFTCTFNNGMWTFTGTVADDKTVDGLTVTFGGLLEGHSAVVNADGTFTYYHTFPPDTTGIVTAIVTDWDGATSEEAYCFVG